MSKENSKEWKTIEKQLDSLSVKDLVRLVHELYESSDGIRNFITARVLKGEASLKKYKQQVYKALYPVFWERLKKLERAARGTGYGYGDSVADMMGDLR